MALGHRSDRLRSAPGRPGHSAPPRHRLRRLLIPALCLTIGATLYPITALAANTWTTQTTGTTTTFYGSSCPSVTTCFAVGASGTIMRTTNGGTSWAAQTSNVGTANPLVGIACSDVNHCVAAGSGPSITVTTNSGVLWTAESAPAGAGGYSRVACPSTLICFAVGAPGQISATTNGGSTWTAQTTTTTQTFEGVSCVSTTTCWAVGTAASGASGVIDATTNGGTTWTAQTSSTGINIIIYGIACTSTTKCFAVGQNGTIQVTTNGGTTWAAQTSPTANSLVAVACWDATHCEAVGVNGTIVGTTNGSTWTTDTTPNATATLQTVSQAQVATGGHQFWAPGDSGQMWTTTVPGPGVTGLVPTSGATQGGTSVVITGTNFTGATAVTFGATAASGYTVNSATQITATSPPGGIGGVVDVTVTTPAGGVSPTATADQYTYTCGGSLSIGAPAAGSVTATIGAGPATGSLPSGTWSDQTGCGSGWNGTIAMSLFHYQGVWAQTAGAATALGSTTGATYTAVGSGYYTVTVTGYVSPTLTLSYTGIESGTGTATLGAGTTTSTIGAKGATIVWGPSSTTYAAGMAYTIKVGNLSSTALTLADGGAPATVAANAGTVSPNPTFTNTTASIPEGSGADPTQTVGAATKFVTAAVSQGMGDYTVSPRASVAFDPSVWAQTYVAQVTDTIVSGP
jgi:large repetitive protein